MYTHTHTQAYIHMPRMPTQKAGADAQNLNTDCFGAQGPTQGNIQL